MDTTQIWTNITAYVLQIGLLAGIGATLPALLRLSGGRAPAARLLHWQMLLLACITLPWMRSWQPEVIAVASLPAGLVSTFSGPARIIAPRAATLPSLPVIGLGILGAGIVLRLLWLAVGLVKLARYRRRGRALQLQPEWTGMAGNTTILVSDEISGPVTFGLFEPVVLLPANFPSLPDAMRQAILFHELLHVERRDWLFTLGEELVRAVFWFHPAIWWVLGEIQLAREQTVDRAVIEMTQARGPYVDTLLAMAGVTAELDLAPAPLFLRRRHLKQRVMGLIQEVRMSKTRMTIARVASLMLLAAACWFVTDVIPLHAQPQLVTDGPGVTVQMNGSQLLHRPPLSYPAEAAAHGVEGTVVVQVRLDANGEVIDDAILSGPDALRRGVQHAVQNWHFDKSEGGSTRVVNIVFVKPPALGTPSPTTPTPRAIDTAVSVARTMQLQRETSRPATISGIVVNGLSDSARDELLARLPVHAGDAYTPEAAQQIKTAAREFDSHLTMTAFGSASGWTVIIAAPEAAIDSAAQRIGGNVQAANIISKTMPVYPPLAKEARVQGTVKFEALIAKEGTVDSLKLISGPPLLVSAAMNAVKEWVYKPVLLNGNPVAVVTTVDVNFSLVDSPAPPQ